MIFMANDATSKNGSMPIVLMVYDIYEEGKDFTEIFWRNLANGITLSRIVSSWVLHAIVLHELISHLIFGNALWSTSAKKYVILILSWAIISDFLDGIISRFVFRRWGFESKWGKILDPLADKVLMAPNEVFMTLYYFAVSFRISSMLPYFIIASLISLIALQSILAIWGWKAFRQGYNVKANRRGKNKMVMECIFNPYWIAGFLFPSLHWLDPLSTHSMAIILVSSLIAVGFAFGSIAGHLPNYKELIFGKDK
jgi:phosphatidylglycerophosphate synthase